MPVGASQKSYTVPICYQVERKELPANMLARFHYIAQLIEEFGLERVREPLVKHLHGALWETRIKGKDGISRALYVSVVGRRVVVAGCLSRKRRRRPAGKSNWL